MCRFPLEEVRSGSLARVGFGGEACPGEGTEQHKGARHGGFDVLCHHASSVSSIASTASVAATFMESRRLVANAFNAS